MIGGIVLQLAAAWLPWTSQMLGGAWLPAQLWLVVGVASVSAWAACTMVARLVWRPRTPAHA